MPFTGINEQNKQRISLLPETVSTIDNDIADFGLKGRSELVNLVLAYNIRHNKTAEAAMNSYRSETGDLLIRSGIKPDKDKILDKLCDTHSAELTEALNSIGTHRRGNIGFYIRISNSIRRWLENPANTEDAYYTSLEHFLNHTIEEYASLDYYTRERILIDEKISQYEKYIDDGVWIDIYRPESATPARVYPYKIMADRFKTHIYMACYRLSEYNSLKPVTYRMSALPVSHAIAYDCDIIVDEKDLDILDELINERGIQFLSEAVADVIVRLTPSGINTFDRKSRLRPIPVTIEDLPDGDKKYTFRCALSQARYYFTNFGKDAEIIAPAELRELFKNIYEDAVSIYQK